ncbi:hypothetical protein [Clostridium sp. 3-3]|uniref:hypothetical protein n=1 Tax=Clostridium sp. 3-3 TaxID=2070757 RepID=UPI0011AF59C6|nr:hypothetical protein [Clostridium sp. 3-3]
MINSSTKKYYKEFQTLPNQGIYMGDYVTWNNSVWIVYEADTDDEIYIDGTLRKCNYKLHWQNESGKIISRYAHVLNASSYNNGESENKTLTLQSNQFMVYLPYDDETMFLDDNKRIHMSRNIQKCKPYEITRIDDISYDFTDKGLINLIFTQVQASPTNDKLVADGTGNKVWICDYKEPTAPPSPTNPGDDKGNQSPILSYIKFSGDPILKIGSSYKKFEGSFADDEGNVIDKIGKWEIISDFGNKITFTISDNVIRLKIPDGNYDLDGKRFNLTFSDIESTISNTIEIIIATSI